MRILFNNLVRVTGRFGWHNPTLCSITDGADVSGGGGGQLKGLLF